MLLLHVCVFLLLVNLSYSHTKDTVNQNQHHESLVFELMKSVHKMMVQHAEDMNELEEKLHNQREEHEEEIKRLETKHADDIKHLKSGVDMKSLESKIDKLQKQHDDDMKNLKMKCDANMKTLQTVMKKHDDDIKELQTKHAEDIKNVRKMIQCPSKLPVKWRGHCYGLFSMALSYQKSQTHCQSLGANLVWIQDSAEQKFLEQTFSPKIIRIWIGCNDMANEGKFVWIHNNQPITYSNWYPGEPNNGDGGAEHCCEMGLHAIGRWNDYPCHAGIGHFICKI